MRGTWPWVVVLAVLALAGGLGAGRPALLHVAYVLLALLVLCPLYAWFSLRALRVEHRAAATRIAAGDRLLEVYSARSGVFWPILSADVVAHPGVTGIRAH